MVTVPRRLRFLPLQLTLLMSVVIALVTLSTLYKERKTKEMWSTVREEALKKYNIKEVDLDYIRKAGLVDHKIEDLTEKDITDMSETELMVTVHSFLDNTDVICRRRIRMGVIGDGGWEICDDEEVRPKSPSCLVYSFGVQEDFAFEEDISRVYKCEVHYFNTNYDRLDYNRTANVFIHTYGIGRVSEITPDGTELFTLDDIRTINGHTRRSIDLIKMDIEGSEWPALYGMLETNELFDVKQLLVECHVGFPPNSDRLRRALRILRDLSKAGFRKFYVLKNPRGSFHHPNFPVMRTRSYEIHYLNSRFQKKKSSISKS